VKGKVLFFWRLSVRRANHDIAPCHSSASCSPPFPLKCNNLLHHFQLLETHVFHIGPRLLPPQTLLELFFDKGYFGFVSLLDALSRVSTTYVFLTFLFGYTLYTPPRRPSCTYRPLELCSSVVFKLVSVYLKFSVSKDFKQGQASVQTAVL